MKKITSILFALALMAASAQAEIKSINTTVFGMD